MSAKHIVAALLSAATHAAFAQHSDADLAKASRNPLTGDWSPPKGQRWAGRFHEERR